MWRDRVRRSQRVTKSRKLVKLAKLIFFGAIGILLVSFLALPLLALNLPSPDKVVRHEGYATQILDRNGETLYNVYVDQRRNPAAFSDMPLYLKQATIAIEDKNFYKHGGFDILGILRGFSRIFTRGSAQGGSTLTQQLVKNVLLTSDRTIVRKIKEFVLAIEIESKYTKDEILQMYLNEAPFGGTAWGVEAASETYFGKKVKDLDLIESAVLAGLPQSPSRYSPYSSTSKAYVARTQAVLRRMREDGYITADQEKNANAEVPNISFQPQGSSFKAPHFVQYVQKILTDRYGDAAVEQGGLKVTTTLDLNLQDKAQGIVSEEIAKVEKQHITNGAVVVINPSSGEILAMVGSKNFNDPNYDGQVNVTTSLRQPGSSFKPFTYVTAFKKGFTASTLIMDVPTTFPGGANNPDYNPVNYDGKYRGPIQLRFAFGNSINIAAVKLLAMVGIKDVLETSYSMGITTLPLTQETLNRVGLSLTLGGGEVRLLDLTDAYAPFMNKGFRVDPLAILKVEDKDGKVLEEAKPQLGKRVLTEEEAFLVANILSDNLAREIIFGTNSLLNIPNKQIAVKTGTTNDRRDNWTVGGNPQALVGVWVGNNDNSQMLNVASGVSGASPIWRRVLLEALSGKPSVSFDIPGNIVSTNVDLVSGFRAHDGFPSRMEYFIKGTEPGEDTVHMMLKVCKTDGKLANPSDIAGGNYDQKEYFVFKEEDPPGILNWLGGQGDLRYHPPNDYCGTANPVNVEFIYPTDRSSDVSNNFTIKFRADSSVDIVSAELEIDGTKREDFTSLPFEYQVSGLKDGVHTLRAKAKDANGKESDRVITIGVNTSWSPSPTP
ncbi:MAG: PBP1A family penicillin-binding protein [Candidatus Woesebacteria bacterium]|nr:PBP1A family penicillin-binding protein [Candidatus Woesebacteria bacterium]